MLERSASNLLLSNTSVVLLEADDALFLCGAAIRYRPNGSLVACSACRQGLGYRKMIAGETAVKYRCNQIEHPPDISRYKQVRLLKPDCTTTIGGGLNAHCRYIVTRSAGLLYERDIHPNPLQICNRYRVTALPCLHIIYTINDMFTPLGNAMSHFATAKERPDYDARWVWSKTFLRCTSTVMGRKDFLNLLEEVGVPLRHFDMYIICCTMPSESLIHI